tara:strand:- start:193 stop:1983 length:1791 start_codon:yes stop_codon:yes gene_type:complete
MAVSPKYNIKFQRGESAFNQLLGQFLGTRVKENKERRSLQLKAANPTEKLKTLRSLIQDKNKILREMVKARQGVSVTEKSGGGRSSSSGAIRERQTNLQRIESYRKGLAAYDANVTAVKATVKQAIKAYKDVLEKNPNPEQEKDARNRLLTVLQSAHGGMLAGISDQDKQNGFRVKIEREISNALKGDPFAGVIIRDLRGANSISQETRLIYSLGGQLTPSQKQLFPSGGGGSKSKTVRGQAMSPEAEQMFKDQLEMLDEQIKEARDEYEESQVEYKRLLRGPDFNLALSPIATRPSAMGEIIDDFTRLQTVDPSYARDVMDASSEAGRFTAPKPYEELLSVRGAAGKSPFDFILDQTSMIDQMTGGIGEDVPLNASDARTILSNVQRMSDSVASPMFDQSVFGSMTVGTRTYGLSEGMKRLSQIAKRGLESNDDQKTLKSANFIKDQLNAWESTLSKDQMETASRQSQPAEIIASYVGEATDAYDRFLDTRNAEDYRRSLSDSYNKIAALDPEIRGLVGDAFLNEVERYSASPEESRLPEELNFKLSGLKDTADELAARNVLNVPDLPSIDIEGTRGPSMGSVRTSEDPVSFEGV